MSDTTNFFLLLCFFLSQHPVLYFNTTNDKLKCFTNKISPPLSPQSKFKTHLPAFLRWQGWQRESSCECFSSHCLWLGMFQLFYYTFAIFDSWIPKIEAFECFPKMSVAEVLWQIPTNFFWLIFYQEMLKTTVNSIYDFIYEEMRMNFQVWQR